MEGRTVCSGGYDSHGFAPDDCKICAHVAGLYDYAKELEADGEEAKAKEVRAQANDLHASIEFKFKAIRGNRILERRKINGELKKVWVADWDPETEDSNVEAGFMSLSKAQYEGLTDMAKDKEKYPLIKTGADLGKRVLWTAKEGRQGKTRKYKAVVWTADKKESPMPELEIPEDVMDANMDEDFEVNFEEIDKVVAKLEGDDSEEVEADEAVEMADSDEEAIPGDADLDDIEGDEGEVVDPEEEAELEEAAEEFEAFNDDDPDVPAEEEKPKPKKPQTRTKAGAKAGKKSGTKVKS